MHVSDGGAALALQPENEGEKTALTRLRAIFRRATQYRLPGPYWVTPSEFPDLDTSGRDALVVQDGAEGADEADGEDGLGVRVVEFEEPEEDLTLDTDEDLEFGTPTLTTDPASEGAEA